MSYTLEKISSLIGAHLVGKEDVAVSWLLTDSRSLCFPEDTLFFALESRRNDGHKYISELYRRGVRSFVVRELPDMAAFPDANFLQVLNPLKALQRLAERHRESFDIPVVGVTGSNGKTVVKEWLYQLMSSDKIVARSPRSYNSQIGVPLSVWTLSESTELGIFEAGISLPGEMDALQSVIQPTIGVFTGLGEAHQENFNSREQKCMEKLRLFRDSKVLVYPIDDPCVAGCVSLSAFKGEYLAWSLQRSDVPLYIEQVEKQADGTTLTYHYHGGCHVYRIPFIDEASVLNSITCLAVCLYMGLTPEQIAERMWELEPVAMRLEVKEGRNGCTLINDSYNSDYNSLDIALDFMNRRPDSEGRRRMLILSDIQQTGQDPEVFYEKVARLVESRGVECFVGVGPQLSAFRRFFTMESYFFGTTAELLSSEWFSHLHQDVILIKGARSFRFDQLTDLLERKVHETILEVNLNAVVDNLNYYRSFLKPETKMVCMVKASAYGAGSFEIAKTLEDQRVDYLAVAVADEGADLRKAGISSPIIIMNPEITAFKTMFDYRLEPEVYSFHLLEELIKAAEREGVTSFPIHVKIDTGMHRLGFAPDEVPRLVERLHRQTAVIPRSVFSHLVGSDAERFDAFTHQQIEAFDRASQMLQEGFKHKILRHICNTAGIERCPEAQFDMVRLGIGLYGIDPYSNRVLHNVTTLKTTILQIHDVPADETVGYSRKGVLARDSRIAAIPIGYADGLNRHLGNGHAYCLVNGKKAPYVGNICMDVCMVDVTDIDCKEGDKVVVFGDSLPVTALSDILDTIPYEILTGVSNRVKRVYYQD